MKGLLILVIPTRWGQSMLRLVHWYWPPKQTHSLISGGDDADGSEETEDSTQSVVCVCARSSVQARLVV